MAHQASPQSSLGASQKQVGERDGVGEGGEGEGGPAEHWWLPQPRKPGEQLLAGCGEPSLLRHGDGDDDQELVARMVVQLQKGATQSPA